jgi:hypothetical protein
MSTTATLDQQIEYMERHVKYMRKSIPLQVEAGRLSEARGMQILATASSTLQTLTQLRGLARIGEAS